MSYTPVIGLVSPPVQPALRDKGDLTAASCLYCHELRFLCYPHTCPYAAVFVCTNADMEMGNDLA